LVRKIKNKNKSYFFFVSLFFFFFDHLILINIFFFEDSNGNLIIVGYFYSPSINFGGGNLNNVGSNDIFIAKLRSNNGSHIWSKSFGSTSNDQPNEFAIDSFDNIIIIGSFSGNINFGGGILSSAGLSDIFVAKFDSNGNHIFSKRFGNTSNDEGEYFCLKIEFIKLFLFYQSNFK